MTNACVIGWPIAHSRSPLIHNHWLAKYRIEGAYTKEALRVDEVRTFVTGLAARGYVGCSVGAPHAEIAFALAAERDAPAMACEAANTLWLDNDKLHASNTNTYGFMTYLEAEAPDWQRRSAPVTVLGAGASARFIVYGLLQAGVGRILLFNKSRERAEELARHFGARVRVHDWEERSAISQREKPCMLVNTTSLGLAKNERLEVDLRNFHADCVIADLVYVPIETRLLAQACARSLRTLDGLGRLLHQAVPGFERWFGVRPDVTDELRQLLVHDIEAR